MIHVEALQWPNCSFTRRLRANRHQLYELGIATRKQGHGNATDIGMMMGPYLELATQLGCEVVGVQCLATSDVVVWAAQPGSTARQHSKGSTARRHGRGSTAEAARQRQPRWPGGQAARQATQQGRQRCHTGSTARQPGIYSLWG